MKRRNVVFLLSPSYVDPFEPRITVGSSFQNFCTKKLPKIRYFRWFQNYRKGVFWYFKPIEKNIKGVKLPK